MLMNGSCFKEPDIDPPACGLHKVPLIPFDDLIDSAAPYLGFVLRLKCPVTRSTVQGMYYLCEERER